MSRQVGQVHRLSGVRVIGPVSNYVGETQRSVVFQSPPKTSALRNGSPERRCSIDSLVAPAYGSLDQSPLNPHLVNLQEVQVLGPRPSLKDVKLEGAKRSNVPAEGTEPVGSDLGGRCLVGLGRVHGSLCRRRVELGDPKHRGRVEPPPVPCVTMELCPFECTKTFVPGTWDPGKAQWVECQSSRAKHFACR